MSAAKHRVLVIGVGSIGERHLRCFAQTGRAELSFVEINPTLRQAILERYPGVRAFPDLDAAVAEQPVPQIAVICTPAQLHIPIALRLAKLGVHLLIEKPLSTTFDGVEELQRVVREKSLIAGVAYVLRCNPALAAMRDAIQSGRFGTPVQAVIVTGQHFPTYRPAYRDIYYTRRETGGGAIQDALTHALNATEWIVGPITRLCVDAGHQVLDGVEVEDTVHLLARHGNLLASYSLNQHQAPNELTVTVICQRGTVRWEAHASRWRWMITPGSDWHDEPISAFERDWLFVEQARRFLTAVENRSTALCSLDEGLQTLRVNLAALASLDAREWRDV